MDIRELRYIIKIAETRNMTKASTALYITQPALSKMLKKVEQEIGMPLFLREGNSMIPTEAGNTIVDYGIGIVSEFELLEKSLSDLKRMKKGSVVFGVPPVIAPFDFPYVIMRYKKLFPDISVEIIEHGARQLEDMVVDGIVDVAISMHPVLSNELSEISILQDQVVCAMNPDHPLAAKSCISIEDLSRYSFNTFPKEFAVNRELMQKFKEEGLMPAINVTSPTCDFLIRTSHLCGEICVLPAPCVKYYDVEGSMVMRPFSRRFPWELCVVYRKNTYMSEKIRGLISCIEQSVNL